MPSSTGVNRMLDLVLVDNAINCLDKVSWQSPKVIAEYLKDSYCPRSCLGKTMDTKAWLVLVDQPWWHFVLGLSLVNLELQVHFYNYSGGVTTPFIQYSYMAFCAYLYSLYCVIWLLLSSRLQSYHGDISCTSVEPWTLCALHKTPSQYWRATDKCLQTSVLPQSNTSATWFRFSNCPTFTAWLTFHWPLLTGTHLCFTSSSSYSACITVPHPFEPCRLPYTIWPAHDWTHPGE